MFDIITGVAMTMVKFLDVVSWCVSCRQEFRSIPEPVRACRDRVCLGTCLEWVDLCWVQPRKRQPRCTEEGNVSEQSKCSALRRTGVVGINVLRDQAGEHDDHGQALTDCASQEQLAAANVLDQPPGRCCEDGVYDHIHTTQDERHSPCLSEGIFKQHGQIVNHCVAAAHLSLR